MREFIFGTPLCNQPNLVTKLAFYKNNKIARMPWTFDEIKWKLRQSVSLTLSEFSGDEAEVDALEICLRIATKKILDALDTRIKKKKSDAIEGLSDTEILLEEEKCTTEYDEVRHERSSSVEF